MSVHEVTRHIVDAIANRRFDLIVCNFANGDMVGHTGVFEAAVRAVEAVDACLGRILAALEATGGQCLITADHGNLECMAEADGGPSTAHTCLPVPLVYAGPLRPTFGDGGTLADVAPTVLTLMDLPKPPEMTGRSLIEALETRPGELRAAQ
jgi:2,3-bisphosphoglycerate-independent phosphoglycerate mutase